MFSTSKPSLTKKLIKLKYFLLLLLAYRLLMTDFKEFLNIRNL